MRHEAFVLLYELCCINIFTPLVADSLCTKPARSATDSPLPYKFLSSITKVKIRDERCSIFFFSLQSTSWLLKYALRIEKYKICSFAEYFHECHKSKAIKGIRKLLLLVSRTELNLLELTILLMEVLVFWTVYIWQRNDYILPVVVYSLLTAENVMITMAVYCLKNEIFACVITEFIEKAC